MSQPLTGSETSYDVAMKIRSATFREWEEEGGRRGELHNGRRHVVIR